MLSTIVEAREPTMVRFNLNDVRADIFSAAANETGLITGMNQRQLGKVKWLPVDYGCMLFKWGNKGNQKKWLQKIFNNDIKIYKNPVVEFVGVRPGNVKRTCLVDNIKYYSGSISYVNDAAKKTVAIVNRKRAKEKSRLEVDVRVMRYTPSYQNAVGGKLQPAFMPTYTMAGKKNMRIMRVNCTALVPKAGIQSLNIDRVKSLKGKLILTDVSISENVCYFGKISHTQ